MTKLLKVISAVVFLLGISVAQYAPIPNAAPQYFDSSGNPLSGGKLYQYACGTTTQLATYTDATAATTNANPIILNSAGFTANVSGSLVGVFLGPSCYKFQLQNSAGSIQWTVDNIYGQFLFNGYLTLIERSAPSGIALDDLLWGDSTAHRLKAINNNGTATTYALFTDNLSVFAATTSAQLAGVLSDETGSGPAVFANTPTIVTPNITTGGTWIGGPDLTSPRFLTGVNGNGSGFKHQRFGITCATAAAVGATCNSAFTWTSTFADTSYTVVCTGGTAASGIPIVEGVSVSATQVTVTIAALTAAAAQANSVNCIAAHD